MKRKITSSVLLILMLVLLSSCTGPIPITGRDATTATDSEVDLLPTDAPTEPPSPNSIGTVSNIRTQVHAGTRDSLKLIEGETELGNDDFVSVTDGGKARLEFPGPISLLLFNQSDMDGIKLEYDANSNPLIRNRLIRGGFSGYVEPRNQLTVDLAFGVKVNVLGTNFFIIYDDENDFIIIGKFDGTLTVSVPGQNDVYLEDSELVDITSDGTIKHFSPISFTSSGFEKMADTCNSPIQGVNILRRDNGLPLPGEATADKDRELPCGSLPQPTPSTTTPACQTVAVSVKSNNVYLREGPDIRFAGSAEYKKGEKFTVLGHHKDWLQVEAPNGSKGWLYKDWLELSSNIDIDSLCSIPAEELPPTPQTAQNEQKDGCIPTYYVACP